MLIGAADIHAATLYVTDYGATASAVPNGVDDDTAGFNAAIAAANPGDVVYIPKGYYDISDTINVNQSNITIKGENLGWVSLCFTIVTGKTDPVPMLQIDSQSDVQLRDFCLHGWNNTDTTKGIYIRNSQRVTIDHMRVTNIPARSTGDVSAYGIYLNWHVTESVISNSEVKHIGRTSAWGQGMRLSESSDNQVCDNLIAGTGRGGIFANNGSTDLLIEGNTIEESGVSGHGLGIELHWGNVQNMAGQDRTLIQYNEVDHWISIIGGQQIAVRYNHIGVGATTLKSYGLEYGGTTDLILSNNLIDGWQYNGISSVNNGSDVQTDRIYVAGNVVSNVEAWGAELSGMDNAPANRMYFYDNVFENTFGSFWGGCGFRIVKNCKNIVLDGNDIVNNAVDGLRFSESSVDRVVVENNLISANVEYASRSFLGQNLLWDNNTVFDNGVDYESPSVGNFDQNQAPSVTIVGPTTATVGVPVSFTYTVIDDGTIDHVLWDMDEGVGMTVTSPVHAFSEPGVYPVSLVVWDDGGRADHDRIYVIVSAP
jgi:hypothetical protein